MTMRFGPSVEPPAVTAWRAENPVRKLAKQMGCSFHEVWKLAGFMGSVPDDTCPRPSVIEKLAPLFDEDPNELVDRFHTWKALKPDSEHLQLATEIWLRKCPMLKWRDDRGWNQSELAQESGVSVPTISLWERGKTEKGTLATLEKIAAAFGRSPVPVYREMLTWRNERPSARTARRYVERQTAIRAEQARK